MKKTILFLIISFTIYAQKPSGSEVLIPFRVKKLWGLSDTLGNLKVNPIYKEIKSFFIEKQNDKYVSRYVVKTNKSYFVINEDRKVFLPETNTYDSIHISKYYPECFWVFKKGKTGLFLKNKEIIPCLYDDILPTQNGSFRVQKGDLAGLINASGKLIIPVEYIYISTYREEETDEVEEKDEKATVDKFVWIAGTSKSEKKYYDTKVSENNIVYATIYEKRLGSETISGDSKDYDLMASELLKTYDKVQINQSLDIAYVTKNNLKGVIDLVSNTEIINLIYDEVIYDGINKDVKVFKTKRNGKYGLIQSGNKAILNCEFDDINEDHILTKDNRKGVFVFNTIYPFIKPKYTAIKSVEPISISDFWQFGLFEVTTEKGKGYVGENGVEFFKD